LQYGYHLGKDEVKAYALYIYMEKTYLFRRHNSRSVQFLLHLVQRTYHEGGTAIFSARLAWTLHDFLPNEVNNRANVYSINTIPLI
jgi:hypothetical protein